MTSQNKSRLAFLCLGCLDTYYFHGEPADKHYCDWIDCDNEEPLKWFGEEDIAK